MAQLIVFLLGIGITALISVFVAQYLRPHLAELLVELCGSEKHGHFWIAFTNVTLVLIPVIASMINRPQNIFEPAAVIFEISNQLMWGLSGLAASVIIIGTVISSNLPKRLSEKTSTHPGEKGLGRKPTS